LSKEDIDFVYSTIEKKRRMYYGVMDVLYPSEEPARLRLNDIGPNFGLVIRPDGEVRIDCTCPFSIENIKKASITELREKAGKDIWDHPKVIEYTSSVKSTKRFVKSAF
jgi:hypothetical protein